MKLCISCGSAFPDNLLQCPKCGAPAAKNGRTDGCLTLFILWVVMAMIYYLIKN